MVRVPVVPARVRVNPATVPDRWVVRVRVVPAWVAVVPAMVRVPVVLAAWDPVVPAMAMVPVVPARVRVNPATVRVVPVWDAVVPATVTDSRDTSGGAAADTRHSSN